MTSYTAARIAARLAKKFKIKRELVVFYVINQFILRDITHISNGFLCRAALCDRKTAMTVIKKLVLEGLIDKEEKVHEKDGKFATTRTLKIIVSKIDELIKDDQEYLNDKCKNITDSVFSKPQPKDEKGQFISKQEETTREPEYDEYGAEIGIFNIPIEDKDDFIPKDIPNNNQRGETGLLSSTRSVDGD